MEEKDLLEKILGRIQKERRLLVVRRRIFVFSCGIAGSIAVFIPALNMVRTGFIESGFTQFFSLLFSDTGTIMAYWKNFAMSLLETMPVLELAILSFSVLAFLEFLKFLLKNIKYISTLKQLKLTNY